MQAASRERPCVRGQPP